MREVSIPTKEVLIEEVQQTVKSLDKLISAISQGKMNNLEQMVWNLRADLELLILKFKIFLEKEDGKERWQKTFLDNLKGTSSRLKAIEILKGTALSLKETLRIFTKNPVECYKYFWKLKETISSIM